MSQLEKLIQRIKSLDKNLRFDELRKVLELYGFVMGMPGRGGSHRTFRKEGFRPITIPVNNPVKLDYVKVVKELIEGDEKNDERS